MTYLAERNGRPSRDAETAIYENSLPEYATVRLAAEPDRDQAARFAEVLHARDEQRQPSDAVAVFIGRGNTRHDWLRDKNMQYAPGFPGDAEGVNSYMAVCRFERGSLRRRADSVVLVPGVWADLDIKPGASDQPHDGAELETIMAALPRPTMLVDSGSGGMHPYWLLPEMSSETEECKALLQRWHQYLNVTASRALGRSIAVDSVFDLARIMKVPGTWRWPKGSEDRSPVRLLIDDGPRYDFAQLWELSETGEPVAAADGAQAKRKRGRPKTAPPAPVGTVTASPRRVSAYVTNALERTADDLASMASESGRNNALNEAAISLGGLAPWGLVDRNDVYDALSVACEDNGLIADDGREAFEATFASGWDAGQAQPSKLPAWMTEHETGTETDMGTHTGATGSAERDWPTPEDIAKSAKTPLPGSGERDGTGIGAFGAVERNPKALWEMVDAVSETYQVPRDLPFMLSLAILAIAVGGRRRVRVGPDWVEVLSVYSVVGLPSGERKSPVISRMSGPLRKVETEHIEAERPKVAQAKHKRELYESKVTKIKRKGDTSEKGMAEFEQAVKLLESTEVPTLPRLLADDSTPEAMARIMSDQGGRLGVLSAEGGLFATLAGRYSSGVPNLDLVLKAWSGDECRIDRVSREPIILPEPVLSIGLAIQPATISGMAEGKNFRGSGLLARFLYALPASMVGTRAIDPPPLADGVERGWTERLEALTRAMLSETTAELNLDDDARKQLIEFQRALEPRLHPERGDLAHIADWANKLAGELVRLAALFTLFEEPTATEVNGEMMAEAIDLADYFISHAVDAFELMSGRRSPLEPSRAVLKWMKREAEARDEFTETTVREVARALHGQEWVAEGGNDAVREVLSDLEGFGYVRKVPKAPKAGRPSERYEVHPRIGTFGTTNRGAQ